MMQPRLASTIERRLLVNYRLDPELAARLIPAPLRPTVVRGHAVAGICLLRLADVRPSWRPMKSLKLGLRSENAAHRFAVDWDGPSGVETGVYIPRRDSASRLNTWAGGRLFPGEHHRADFQVHETGDELDIAYTTRDRTTRVHANVELVDSLSDSELFGTLSEASDFFRGGAKGYSATRDRHLDGMALHTDDWHLRACRILTVESTYFDDTDRFPAGSALLDCAVVIQNLAARWQPLPAMATN